MRENTVTLGEFLLDIEQYSWGDQVFASSRPWHEDCVCLIINTDDLEDPASDPIEVMEMNLSYIAQVSTVQDVVRGFKVANSSASVEDLIIELESYLDRDA